MKRERRAKKTETKENDDPQVGPGHTGKSSYKKKEREREMRYLLESIDCTFCKAFFFVCMGKIK